MGLPDQPAIDRLPAWRAVLLETQESLTERHNELRAEDKGLLEHREHRDQLIEHREALAEYHATIHRLSESRRERLLLTRAVAETEQMLAETLEVISDAREAWKRATDTWQRVRDRLDKP